VIVRGSTSRDIALLFMLLRLWGATVARLSHRGLVSADITTAMGFPETLEMAEINSKTLHDGR